MDAKRWIAGTAAALLGAGAAQAAGPGLPPGWDDVTYPPDAGGAAVTSGAPDPAVPRGWDDVTYPEPGAVVVMLSGMNSGLPRGWDDVTYPDAGPAPVTAPVVGESAIAYAPPASANDRGRP